MSNVLRKSPDTNGVYHYIEGCSLSDYPSASWEHNPDVSALSAVSRNYWKWSAGRAVEMTQGEKDLVDEALSVIDNSGTSEKYVIDLTLAANEAKTISVPFTTKSFVTTVFEKNVPVAVSSTLLSASGSGPVGWDPGNVSTNETSINNGSFTDLVYNISVPGNTSGVILGIDMLKPTTINFMKKVDYSTAYFDLSWEFIGTNNADGTGYTVIFAANQTTANLHPNAFERAFADVTFRYYGWRCVTSNNASYTIVRELELYNAVTANVDLELVKGTDYTAFSGTPGQLTIENLTGSSKDITLVCLG